MNFEPFGNTFYIYMVKKKVTDIEHAFIRKSRYIQLLYRLQQGPPVLFYPSTIGVMLLVCSNGQYWLTGPWSLGYSIMSVSLTIAIYCTPNSIGTNICYL